MPPTFVLDQNFPQNIINALRHIPEANLTPLIQVDPALTMGHEDWEILRELHKNGFDGFITADSSMLQLPKELSVLLQTRLTLVVTERVGHDSIQATGLLLMHLPHIAHQTNSAAPQLWRLRPPSRKNHEDPWERLREVADGMGQSARMLYRREQLAESELE